MKTVSLSGSPRVSVGKKDAKANRKEGKIPCVLYGGEEQIHFTIDFSILRKIIYTPEVYLLKITIDGKLHDAVVKDMQFHPVTDDVLHVDFLEVLPGKPVIIDIPLSFSGAAKGVVQKGGVLHTSLRKIATKGLVGRIPERVEIDITDIDLNDSIKIKDIHVNDLEFLDDPNRVIVAVKTARATVTTEEEGEGEEGEGEEGAPAAEGGEAPKAEAPAEG